LYRGGICKRGKFAYCTRFLKLRVRQTYEAQNVGVRLTYVWGFDCNETARAERLIEAQPHQEHLFPLIEHNLTKQDAHALCRELGIKRPMMYDLGYNNNNCIGCVKGGIGYWNKIRVDFPEVFERRAKLERRLNSQCLKEYWLDELPPDKGRMSEEIMEECGIFCQLALQDD